MSHMVIYRSADGTPSHQQIEQLEEAVRFVERLRNEQGVTEAKLFDLVEVPISFKAYYQVEVAGRPATPAAPSPAPAPAPPAAAAPVEAVKAAAPAAAPAAPAPAPAAAAKAPAPPAPAAVSAAAKAAEDKSDASSNGGGRFGLFGKS